MKKIILLLLICFSCSIEQKDLIEPIVSENGQDGISTDFWINEDGSTTFISYLDSGGENRNGRYDVGEQWFRQQTRPAPQNGEDGQDAVQIITEQEAFTDSEGRQCVNIRTYADRNSNWQFDEATDELLYVNTICGGLDGNSGEEGRSILVTTREATEFECSNGGTTTTLTYDDGEFITEYSTCNGFDGSDGNNGGSSMVISEIIPEGELCEYGGLRIIIMNDKNADGDFEDEGEVKVTEICLPCKEKCELVVLNTDHCQNNANYVVWLRDNNGKAYYFSNVDLVFERNDDYTATLKGKVKNPTLGEWYLETKFSEFITVTPEGSPKESKCGEADYNNFVYYLKTEGTMKKLSGADEIEFVRRGEAFQLGIGANETEEDLSKLSASGWFEVTNECEYSVGDINITFEEICE